VKQSATAQNSATLSVAAGAKGFGFVTTLGPDRGKADILVDGVKVKTVDLYRASITPAQLVWSVDGLDPSTAHTVKIVVTGAKHSASTGTKVDVDALLVRR
jgi:hypothetical protein